MRNITRNFVAIALIAGLSACSSSDEKTSDQEVDVSSFEASGDAASAEGAAPKMSKEIAAQLEKLSIKPGKWKYTIKYEKMEMNVDKSTLSPEEKKGLQMVRGMIKEVVKKEHKNEVCISKEQAEKQAAEFFVGQNAKDCTYDRFSADNGKLDMAVSCKGVQGSENAKVTLTGNFTDDKVDSRMTILGESEFGYTMEIVSDIKREFVGACDK